MIKRLALGTLSVNLFVFVLAGLAIHQSRLQYRERAEITTQNLSRVLEENIDGAVDKIDMALLSAQDEVRRQIAGGRIDAKALNAFLAQQQDHQPEILSLRIVDAEGVARYGRGVPSAGGPNNSDREYFIRARDEAQPGLIVTKPVFTRLDKKWAVVLARRLSKPDGSFAGVVYVNVALEHFSKIFSEINVGPHGSVTLRGRDLGLITRFPEPDDFGKAIGSKPSPEGQKQLLSGRASGTFQARNPLDNVERTLSYRKMSDKPFYITVGVAQDDYLAVWRQETAKMVALLALFFLVTLLASWLIYRSWKRQTVDAETVREQKDFLDAILNSEPECVKVIAPNGRLLQINRAGLAMLEVDSFQEAEQLGLLGFVLPEYRDAFIALSRRIFDGESASLEFLIEGKKGTRRWLDTHAMPLRNAEGEVTALVGVTRDITTRKQMEDALRKSEEKHKALIETTDTGYVIVDSQGRVTDANGEYVRLTGHASREEILGRRVTEWTADYDRDRNAAEVEKCLQQGFVRGLEIDYVDRQGKITPIEINATILKSGDSIQLLALSRDITQRKQTETGMREALAKAQRLATALDSVPSYIYIKNKNHQYVYANRPVLEYFRCSAEELPGSDDTRFFPPETVARLRAVDDRVLEGGETTREEIDVSPDSPDRRVFWEVKQPFYDENGEIWGLCGVSTDITERKRIEDALRQSEFRLNELFENMSSGVAVYRASPDGQDFFFTALNRAAERIENLHREDLIGKNLLAVFPGAADFGILDVLRRVWRSGVAEQFPISFYRDERIIGWRENYVYKLPSGELVAIYDDVTQRKQAELALKQLNENLEQRVKDEVAKNTAQERLLIQQSRLAAMGEMIGNIAHQWRQPLSVLGLLLAEIQDAYAYNELDKESLEKTVETGRRMIHNMSSTIDDFRNFFKPNKEKEVFSLGKAVMDAVKLIEPSLKGHNLAVQVEEGGEVQVNGYRNELSQVLLNIFANAKEAFLERKLESGNISVSWGSDGEKAWVAVRDNAGGIPSDVLRKIFDPYFTTKEKGTGIGLYMSKTIMEHMNGRIEAANVEGGAEFLIVCPLSNL